MLSSKIITTSSSFIGTFKYASSSAREFYLVDVIEDVIMFVHVDGEELTPYEPNVRQAFGLMDVTQGFPRFCLSFTSFDMHQLLVHQICGNDSEGLLASLFVRLFDLFTRRRRWRQLRTLHDFPKIFGGHHHLQLELIDIELLPPNLSTVMCPSPSLEPFCKSNTSSHTLN